MRFFENRAPTNDRGAVAAPGGPLFAIEGHLSFDTGLAVSDTPTLEHHRHGSAPGVGG